MANEFTVGLMALLAGAGLALFIATFWFQPLEKLRGWFAAGVLAGGLFLAGRWTRRRHQTPSDAIEDADPTADTADIEPLPQPSTSEAELRARRELEDETFNPEKPDDAGDGAGGRNWLDL